MDFVSLVDKTTIEKRREFVAEAKRLKEEGNQSYVQLQSLCKQLSDAVDVATKENLTKEIVTLEKTAKRRYHAARLQAQAAFPVSSDSQNSADKPQPSTSPLDELKRECHNLLVSIFNNLAAVIMLRSDSRTKADFERACQFCANALVIQKTNTKSMYRMAQALENLGDLEGAMKYLQHADNVENHKNAAIRRDMVRVEILARESDKQAGDLLKRNLHASLFR